MRYFRWFALVLALVAFGSMPIALAQTESSPYVVKPDDTVYALKGIYSSSQPEWKAFTMLNPFLAEPGRAFVAQDGRFIVVIRPGETLEGVERLGITVEPLPVSELGLAPTETTSVPGAQAAEINQTALPGWPWLLLIFLALLVVASFIYLAFIYWWHRLRAEAREREMRQPVETAGPPMVPGGIPPTDAARLTNFFDQQAVARFSELQPRYSGNVGPERVGPIEHGMLGGDGEVRDLQGRWHPRRVEPPQPGYQARFRYPDGTEENMQAYEICMNIVRRGEGMRGFTFTPGQTVVQMPEPSTPAPQAVPHPAMAVRRIREAAQEEGVSTVTIGDRVITVERGVHFAVSDDGSITMTGLTFEMTVRPAQRAQADQPQLAAGASQ